MSYYSLYNYKINDNKNIIWPSNTACFARLFGASNIKEVNIFLLYGNKNTSSIWHNTIHHKGDLDLFFESLKDVTLIVPTVYELDEEQLKQEIGSNIEDVEEYGFDTSAALKVSFGFKGMSKMYIKLLCTLTRYFYEEECRYKDIINNYLKYLDDPKYITIPRIELFQLVHSTHLTYGGHALFSNSGSNEIIPIKIETVRKNLNNPIYTRLNDVFSVSTSPSELSIYEILNNYLYTL